MHKPRTSYSLRMADSLRKAVENIAWENRRSLNAELQLLIEQGMKWREANERQV